MATTTSYGTYANATNAATGTMVADLRTGVLEALGEHGDAFDVDGIAAEIRDGINAALVVTGIRLCGDEFVGPHAPTEDEADAMAALVSGADTQRSQHEITAPAAAILLAEADFWAVAQRHEIDA